MSEQYRGNRGWCYTYQVKGGFPFPLDMLRYDEAVPATSADRLLVERLTQDAASSVDDVRNRHIVTLRSNRRPTAARWKSFLWTVVS